MDEPTLETASQAVQRIAETDLTYAKAKAHYLAEKELLKVYYSMAYLDVEQGTVENRKASAFASSMYREALNRYRDAAYHYETIGAQRKSAELAYELWRSYNSARSRGIVT